jgi:glycosyltransferase involved in cell wall biosynthesis
VPDVYFATDVLVVTSDNEGTNVSAIEAQAAGLPVVSTRVGGMPSVVDDGTGLLVDADDEQGFARTLEQVLLDDGLRRDLGQRGAERGRSKFSLARLVENVDFLYRQLMSEVYEPSQTGMMVSRPAEIGEAREAT